MNSLEYGVNLSRRACRIGTYGIMFLLAVGLCSGVPKPPDHAADISGGVERRQPPVNLDDYNIYDLSNLYKIIPTQARPYDTPTTTETNLHEIVKPTVAKNHAKSKKDKRYPVISVSFHRVETPFIIGLWIFCASLAKIGKLIALLNMSVLSKKYYITMRNYNFQNTMT